ncbi:hypothetical protein KI387_033704, partial [Taxus chinensis]
WSARLALSWTRDCVVKEQNLFNKDKKKSAGCIALFGKIVRRIMTMPMACPYDRYLVTDTNSKEVQEANPVLADAIGRVTVHYLHHKSGYTWKGPLSESIAHGNGYQYGSSAV